VDDAPISRGINIAGQTLDIDPRTGKCEVNHARPFSKSAWRQIAKPHTVTVVHADGNESVVTIAGATHSELRDDVFVGSVATGGGIKHRITNQQWHACVMRLAALFPDKVGTQDGIKPVKPVPAARVVVAAWCEIGRRSNK
jgi:hypothetical protein